MASRQSSSTSNHEWHQNGSSAPIFGDGFFLSRETFVAKINVLDRHVRRRCQASWAIVFLLVAARQQAKKAMRELCSVLTLACLASTIPGYIDDAYEAAPPTSPKCIVVHLACVDDLALARPATKELPWSLGRRHSNALTHMPHDPTNSMIAASIAARALNDFPV